MRRIPFYILYTCCAILPIVIRAQTTTTVSKSCGRCGKPVSAYAEVGGSCPHCHVRWSTERTTTQTKTISVPVYSAPVYREPIYREPFYNEPFYSADKVWQPTSTSESEVKTFVQDFLSASDNGQFETLKQYYADVVQRYYNFKEVSKETAIAHEKAHWRAYDYEKLTVGSMSIEREGTGFRIIINATYTKDYRTEPNGRPIVKTIKVDETLKIYYIRDRFVD